MNHIDQDVDAEPFMFRYKSPAETQTGPDKWKERMSKAAG